MFSSPKCSLPTYLVASSNSSHVSVSIRTLSQGTQQEIEARGQKVKNIYWLGVEYCQAQLQLQLQL